MTAGLRHYSDEHYTDPTLAQRIVQHFQPAGRCLEPFRGKGAFLSALPAGSLWCDLAAGRDFFDFNEPVDWIVTNPYMDSPLLASFRYVVSKNDCNRISGF